LDNPYEMKSPTHVYIWGTHKPANLANGKSHSIAPRGKTPFTEEKNLLANLEMCSIKAIVLLPNVLFKHWAPG